MSSLRELRCSTGRFEAVFLTLLHTRIPGKEPGLLEDGTVILTDQQQSAGDAVTDGAGLAGYAATGDGAFHIELALNAQHAQRLADNDFQSLQTEVIIEVTAVDGDLAVFVDLGSGQLCDKGVEHGSFGELKDRGVIDYGVAFVVEFDF